MTQLSIRVVERNDALDIAAASPTPKLGDVRVTGQNRITCSGKPRSDSNGTKGGWLGNAWGDHCILGTFRVIARLFPCDPAGLMAASRAYLACCGFGFVSNTATTAFHVFYRLQVTGNLDDAPLLQLAPNRPDYIHIWALWLHGHRSEAVFALEWQTDRVIANIFIALPLPEIVRVLVRLAHVA